MLKSKLIIDPTEVFKSAINKCLKEHQKNSGTTSRMRGLIECVLSNQCDMGYFVENDGGEALVAVTWNPRNLNNSHHLKDFEINAILAIFSEALKLTKPEEMPFDVRTGINTDNGWVWRGFYVETI